MMSYSGNVIILGVLGGLIVKIESESVFLFIFIWNILVNVNVYVILFFK